PLTVAIRMGTLLPLRKRPEIGGFVGERAASRAFSPRYEARARRHLRVVLPLRVTPAVKADRRTDHPRSQVDADKPSVLQTPPHDEIVPGRCVADVLKYVLILVGPEVMDVVKGGSRTEHRQCRGGAVMLGAVVVLDANPAEDRMAMVGDIARRVDVGRACPA